MRNDSPTTLDIDNKPVLFLLFIFFSVPTLLVITHGINVAVGKGAHTPTPDRNYRSINAGKDSQDVPKGGFLDIG